MVVNDILLPCMAERTFPRLWFGFVKACVCLYVCVSASTCICICMRVGKLYVCTYRCKVCVCVYCECLYNCVSFNVQHRSKNIILGSILRTPPPFFLKKQPKKNKIWSLNVHGQHTTHPPILTAVTDVMTLAATAMHIVPRLSRK